MYIESTKTKLRSVGYGLIGVCFIYFSLEPLFARLHPTLLYGSNGTNNILPYFLMFLYTLILTGAALINYHENSKLSLGFMVFTLLLGLPFPIQGLYSLSHPRTEYIPVLYDMFAIAILLSVIFSLIYERKAYKLIALMLFFEWFFFNYIVALSGQYFFLSLSSLLTHMVSFLIVIYCILEIIFEKSFKKIAF